MADQNSAQDLIRISQYHLAFIAGGFGITGGLIGAWLNHYFSGSRDRRKEFNEAAEVLSVKLIKERNNASPFDHSPTDVEFEIFSQHLPFWKRGSFNRCVEKYKKTKTDNRYTSSEYGDISYHDKNLIVSACSELLKFTKRK
jgi:hypothetical protein